MPAHKTSKESAKGTGKTAKKGASSTTSGKITATLKNLVFGKKGAAPAAAAAPAKKAAVPTAKTQVKVVTKAQKAPAVVMTNGKKPSTAVPIQVKGKKAVPIPPVAKAGKMASKAPAIAPAQVKGKGKAAGTSAAISARHSTEEAVCREVACEGLATTAGYCRMHYIKNWKKIKRKELILREKKLNQYIEELVAKYPDKYIEAIRQDLANDKDFAKVIHDLDLDESIDDFEMEGESVDNLIDNIKRDFDDEGESF